MVNYDSFYIRSKGLKGLKNRHFSFHSYFFNHATMLLSMWYELCNLFGLLFTSELWQVYIITNTHPIGEKGFSYFKLINIV